MQFTVKNRQFDLPVTFLKRASLGAWQNFLRNKLLNGATILIIALMLFVFNLVLALSFASDSIIETVGEKLDISIEMKAGVENYSIQSFIQTLERNPLVKETVFISQEEALGKFGSKYPNVISFLEYNKLSNPLPNVVRVVSQGVDSNNELINFLERPQFAELINQEKLITNLDQKERNAKILSITRSIQRVSFWLILIFALVGLMIIFNSININVHTQKDEVNIMKLVGAKYNFIRSGYMIEGVILAVSALFISLLFARLILAYLARNLAGVITNETLISGLNAILVHFQDRFWLTFGWQLLLTIAAGLVSSYLAIELYLRKEHSF